MRRTIKRMGTACLLITSILSTSSTVEARHKKSITHREHKRIAKTKTTTEASLSLDQKIDRILEDSGLITSDLSIKIISLKDSSKGSEKILYQRNADRLLNPASNVKLLTAAAALKQLGADYTFKTEFYSDRKNLWIKGYGDPLLVTEDLEDIASRVKASGLKEVSGQVYVDDSYFGQEREDRVVEYGSGSGKGYEIQTNPLSFNFNHLELVASAGSKLGSPAILTLNPPSRFVRINNQTKTGAKKSRLNLSLAWDKQGSGTLIVRGNVPKTSHDRVYQWEHIPDPAVFTGLILMEALAGKGIRLQGDVKRKLVPEHAELIAAHHSPPLSEILSGLGKFSNNFMAEQLLRVVGAAHLGAPGTTDKGVKALEDYLLSLGAKPGSFVLRNGSGLSKQSRLSANQLVETLTNLYSSDWREELISSLSIGGQDGTLKRRFRKSVLNGLVYGKTGTLDRVSALSGYILPENKHGKGPIIFSFLFNNFKTSVDKIRQAEESTLEAVWKTWDSSPSYDAQ